MGAVGLGGISAGGEGAEANAAAGGHSGVALFDLVMASGTLRCYDNVITEASNVMSLA